VEGVPTITERHWYPVFNDYRTAQYPSPRPTGIDELAVQSCLFTDLHTQVCATADFLDTWRDAESFWVDAFRRMISKATVEGEDMAAGEPCVRLVSQAYETDEQEKYLSRKDTFWVNPTTHLLTAWRIERVSIRYGDHASYQVIDSTYSYLIPEPDDK
jgi:hypothetical protein